MQRNWRWNHFGIRIMSIIYQEWNRTLARAFDAWKTPARNRGKERDINHSFQKLNVMSCGLGIQPNGGGGDRRSGKTPEIIMSPYTIYCSRRLHTRRYVRLWKQNLQMEMEAIRSSETSVQSTTSTRRHILHSHRRDNQKIEVVPMLNYLSTAPWIHVVEVAPPSLT
jgi:hypothetical protein